MIAESFLSSFINVQWLGPFLAKGLALFEVSVLVKILCFKYKEEMQVQVLVLCNLFLLITHSFIHECLLLGTDSVTLKIA